MTRTNEVSENEYLSLRKQALKDKEKLNLEGKSADEKHAIVMKHLENLRFSSDEEERLYVANLLLPDAEEFQKIYVECEKKLNVCAEKLAVPQACILARVYDINKYSKYLPKGDVKMKDIEIIEDEFVDKKENAKEVDVQTSEAISKINLLFNENDSKAQTIERQNESIKRLNERIDFLEDVEQEKDDTIRSQKVKIKDLETKIATLELEAKVLKDYKKAYDIVINAINSAHEVGKEDLDSTTIINNEQKK